MNPAATIWKRECLGALRSPASWWIVAGFTAVAGLRFTSALRIAAGTIEHMPAVFCTQLLLALCIPVALFTMGLFASERANGTLEPLMTAPVSGPPRVASARSRRRERMTAEISTGDLVPAAVATPTMPSPSTRA